MLAEVKALIDHYKLSSLPVEGTLFSRTYRSTQEFSDGKPVGTAMVGLYCEEPFSVSLFHKLSTDELWHFYAGDPFRLILLYPDGSSKDIIMGNDPLNGQYVQFLVPAGVWQAGHMIAGGKYSLYGCSLAPGFTDDKFEGATSSQLIKYYLERADDINKYGCNEDDTSMPKGSAS